MSYPPPPYDPNQPQYGPPPYGGQPFGYPPPPAPKRNNTKLVLAIVGGVLALCCGGVVVVAIIGNNAGPETTVSTQAPAAAGKATTGKVPADRTATPAEPAGDDAGKFGLKPGTTLTVTDGGDTHEVTVKSMKSTRKSCQSFDSGPKKGHYLIADVTVRVIKGTASVNSLYFTWVGEDGTTSDGISGAFSGCDKSSLGAVNDLRAGQKRAGQIVFDVSSPKGELEYGIGAFGSETVGSWANG